ncbi:MAG: Glycerophosphoryl diester phosphodiesterase, partial [uncultured Actinomycetospora sp.]
ARADGAARQQPRARPAARGRRRARGARAHRRRRAPRGVGLPSRAHARGLRARDPPGLRRGRRRPRPHPRRGARRPPRARDRRDHRRRHASRVRLPPHHQGDRRDVGDRLVHHRLHARGDPHAARGRAHPADAPAQHALRRPVRRGHVRRGARPARPTRRRAPPPRRRAARDQALDLLREPRPARRAGARGDPAAPGPRPRRLRGGHPVVRDREPPRPEDPGRVPAAAARRRRRHAARRPRRGGRPAHVGDAGDPGRAARRRRLRHLDRADEGPDRPAGPGRRGDRGDDPRAGRARGEPQGHALHVPQRERVPAGRAATRGTECAARHLRRRVRRVPAVRRARRRRGVQRRPGHRARRGPPL